jgi:hypothetical protein
LQGNGSETAGHNEVVSAVSYLKEEFPTLWRDFIQIELTVNTVVSSGKKIGTTQRDALVRIELEVARALEKSNLRSSVNVGSPLFSEVRRFLRKEAGLPQYIRGEEPKLAGQFDRPNNYKFKNNFRSNAASLLSFSSSILMDSVLFRSLWFFPLSLIISFFIGSSVYLVTASQPTSVLIALLLIPICWLLFERTVRRNKKQA